MTRLKDIKNSRRRRVSGKQKNGLGCLGCFGIIWMLFVLGFDGFIGYGFWRTYDARARFLTTPGVVTGSEIERSSGSDGTTYEAKIEYEFELGGTSYTGDRHSFFSFGTSSSEHASEVVRRYPVGKRVTVYYDPGEPEQSVLEVDTRSFPWFAIIFLTPFHCIGIGFLVGALYSVYLNQHQYQGGCGCGVSIAKGAENELVVHAYQNAASAVLCLFLGFRAGLPRKGVS